MLTACCYRVAYFTSATDTTANDNRFTTVVVNINGEADVAVPSRRMFISTLQPDVQADLSGVSTAIVVQNNLINVYHLLDRTRRTSALIPRPANHQREALP